MTKGISAVQNSSLAVLQNSSISLSPWTLDIYRDVHLHSFSAYIPRSTFKARTSLDVVIECRGGGLYNRTGFPTQSECYVQHPCCLGDRNSLNSQTDSEILVLLLTIGRGDYWNRRREKKKKLRLLSIKNLFALNVSSNSALLLVCFSPMSLAYLFSFTFLYKLLNFSF